MKATSMIVLSFGALAAAGSNKNVAGGYGYEDTVPAPAPMPAAPAPMPAAPAPMPAASAPMEAAPAPMPAAPAPAPVMSAPASDVKPMAAKASGANKSDDDCETKPQVAAAPSSAASPAAPAAPTAPAAHSAAAKKVPNSEVAPMAAPQSAAYPPANNDKVNALSGPTSTMPAVMVKPTSTPDTVSLMTDKATGMIKVPGAAKPTQSAYMPAPIAPAASSAYNATTPKMPPVTAGGVSVAAGVGAATFVAAGFMAALLF